MRCPGPNLRDDILPAHPVEVAVPSAWIDPPNYVRPEWIAADAVGFDVARYDPVTQILDENHVPISSEGLSFGHMVWRLAWPAKLDQMARNPAHADRTLRRLPQAAT